MSKKQEKNEPEYDCIHCEDTGFVTKKYFDQDSRQWMDDGDEECGHCGRSDEYDDDYDPFSYEETTE